MDREEMNENVAVARNLVALAIADLSACINEIHFDEAEFEVETLYVVREELRRVQSLLLASTDSRDSAGIQGATMNHLKDAKVYAKQAESVSVYTRQAESISVGQAQAYAQLATAHALIAICERMDEAAKHADLEAERAESARAYQASRDLY